MKNNIYHFLDTNIILAMVLPDDSNYKVCLDYFDLKFLRFACDKVSKESKNLILKLRRTYFSIIAFVKDYLSRYSKIAMGKIDFHINDMRIKFLNQYYNEKFPLGFKKEKFYLIVNNFFYYYESFLKGIILNEDLILLDSFKINISSYFKKMRNKLNVFLAKLINISFFRTCISNQELLKLGIHKSDADILVDAYCLSGSLKEKVNFITLDKGILNHSEKIEHLFLNKIELNSPAAFV